MVVGIVLAAGESKRMGRPKALLTINSKTFIRHVVETLKAAGLDIIIVVLGADAETVEPELVGLDVTIAINENHKAGQLSSIQKGIEAAHQFSPDAVIIHPIDHPLVHPETVSAILRQFKSSSNPIILPTHKGKRGHPVLFSSSVFDDLMNAPNEVGARAVVWNRAAAVHELLTNDEQVLLNVDTPEFYKLVEQEFNARPSQGSPDKEISG
ncbi:MAG: nucleotidyltransferase family protein [Bacteroidota bacterium]